MFLARRQVQRVVNMQRPMPWRINPIFLTMPPAQLMNVQTMAFGQRYRDFSDEDGDADHRSMRGNRRNYDGQSQSNNYNRDRRSNPSWNQDRRESSYRQPEDDEAEVTGYISYSDKVRRVTYEDLNCDEVNMDILDKRAQEVLSRNGITELFPVQKAAYKLFVDGEELIVK